MKRSSKKSRNLKKKSQKKCLLATGMMVCLGTFPVWSNDDVLLTLIPNAGKAFGSAAGIDYDYGLGAKLTYRKGDSLDFFLQGDYKRLAIDKLSPVDLMSISAGAGYHFKLNDRLGLNLSAQAGAYMASKSDGMVTGPTAGLSVSFTYRLNPVVSIEAGANVSHYAASPQPLLTDAGGSAALTVNLTEAFTDTTKVKMETNELLPVFPVLYSWYKNNAFATVGITNQEDAAIEDVTVSFYQSQFMNQPNVCAKVDKLGAGETVNAELTAFFNERMLDLTEKTDTEATVIIEYSYLGKKKKKEIGMIVPVYGRNSMSWDDDRRAAVFVSSKDPAALWFAKYISSIVRDNARPATRISQNIQYAMGIFETLDQFGLNYVIDPSSAYSDNVGGSSIDFLQFPFQTLTYRGGDCDDISILVCSLFEAVGIKTGFITIPGHIFMAFDSGLTMKEAGQSMMNTSNLFDLKGDGEAWIPLEITLTDEGFSRAWKVGAREWTTTAPEDRMFYAMEDCWKLYEPVSVPGATANFTLPEQKIVTRLFQHSMDNWIAKEISPVISQYNMLLARNESDQLRNELGILYGEYGLFVEADDQFKRARRNGYLPSLLNTANVYFARKQFAIALEWYKQVLEKDPENDLAMLGVARCNYELENFDECDKAYNYLRNKNPELANEYRYLGAFEETRGRSYSLADRLSLTIWDRGEFDSGIINDGTFEQQAELASREDENGFVTSDGANSSDFVDSDTANLFAQLTDMTDPSSVLRPDAIIADTQSYEKVPEDPYAKLDDPSVLVQELPGLIAQLRLPEPDFGNTDPVMISDYQLIAKTQPADTKTYTDAGATVVVGEKPVERTVSTQITQQQPATSTPVIAETSTKAEKKELIAFEKTDPEPTYIAQTPVTTTPSVTETRPSGQTTVTTTQPGYTTQTTVTTQTPVTNEPTYIAQTPVTTTPTVVETRPSGQTSVTTTQPGYTTQTTVTTQTPGTNEPTYVAQTPVTTTPSVSETRPSGQTTVTTTQPGYTTQTPVTSEPTYIAQTPVTTTQTPATNEPAYTTQTTVTTQTPVTSEPTYIAQTPVTTTLSVTETRPSGQTTTVTTTQPGYTTQTPVTSEPTQIAQTPVTITPTVTETRPSGQTTVTTTQPGYTTQTPVTSEPTYVAQTPVTTTPSVTETRPSGQTTTITTTQTPVTNEPTQITQTPVTTTPSVTETRPSGQTSVTTTQPGYTTQTTVTTQTPVTNEPTYVAQTPATTTPSVTETRPSGQTTTVTTTQPGYTTQTTVATQTPVTTEPTYVAQTPVTTTPSVSETRPSGQTTVTTTQPGYTTQTTVTTQTPVTSEPTQIAQTSVTTTPSVTETRPSGQTSVTTTQPGYTTQTPVTNEPTQIAQTSVTTTPTVTETRPSGQTTVTTTQPAYTTQTTVTTQTPVTTEPTQITQTPVTTTPSVTTTQPGYTTQTPVTSEPTYIAQTPVTTPSVTETRPSGQTTATTQQPGYTTQTAVTTQTPVTTTPSVTETRPSGQTTTVTTQQPGYTTQTTVTTQTPVTNEPTQIAQTPVTTTPSVVETRPSGQTTATRQHPGYTTQTTVTTQTPVTTEPTQIAQTPVTTTPTVTTTQPGYTTQTTVTTQTPVTTEPTQIAQTPVTTTPSVTETRPSGQTTATTTQPGYTTQTPVTTEPTYIAQTPVTITPTVAETRPSGQTTTVTTQQPGYTTQTTVTTQTPVTSEPTYVAQTPVTTTPSVTETRPSGQTTTVTTTQQPAYTTQTTVTTQTPVTSEPTQIAQTPVTTTPSVTETRPSGQTTTVTTQQPGYTTQTTVTTQTPVTNEPTYIVQTPVTTTPAVTETRPSGQTTVTTTQPGYTTQTTVATQTPVTNEPTQITQTSVTTTPTVTETRPSGQTTATTDDVMITDPEVDEWEYEFFESLMNPPNFDDLADAPIGIYEKDDKIVKAESTLPSFNTNIDSAVAIGPELPEEKIVEREAPRFSEQPSSRWVPEQVYSAKTIPGMKTYEEEMALYSNDKSWLYEDEPELLSDDSEETIQREKMQEEAAIREAEEKKNKGKFALTETDDEVLASLFQYLDENVLEEIQHTDLAERINEQARKKITGKKKTPVASTEPVVQDKKSGLLSKAEEINEKIEEEQIEEIAAVQVEQMEPVAVNIDPEPKIDIGEDAGIKEKSKFNAGPYVAGGAGLVGLLIIFLLIFVKRDDDDDDDDDDKKKNPPKPEVEV